MQKSILHPKRMNKISLYVWGLGFGIGVWGCGYWVGGLYVHTLVEN